MNENTKNAVIIVGMLAVLAVVSFLMFYGLAVQVFLSCSVVDLATLHILTGVIGSASTVAFACLYFKNDTQSNGVQ